MFTHNQAVFITLLRSPNKWVSINEIHEFTRQNCSSLCFNINSRAADLRKFGYNIENKTEQRGSVKHSFYKIEISVSEIRILRTLFKINQPIPRLNQVREKLKPIQTTLL